MKNKLVILRYNLMRKLKTEKQNKSFFTIKYLHKHFHYKPNIDHIYN